MVRKLQQYYLLTAVFAFLFTFGSCKSSKIKIGFIANLSKRGSNLGIYSRNTLYLLVNQINQKGGIGQKQIELHIMDDKNNPQLALKAFKEFKRKNIQLIIGPLTSSMYPAIEKVRNDKNSLIISPTITTTVLSKKDDQFISILSSNKLQAQKTVEILVQDKVQSISVFYDLNNRQYTESLVKLIENYAKNQKIKLLRIPFLGKKSICLQTVPKKLNLRKAWEFFL